MSLRLLLPLLAAALLALAQPPTERYELDPEHTFVTFKVNRFAMVDVVGFFPDVAGTITLDAATRRPTAADITIQTASVYSGKSDGRDEAIKSAFFLDVANYPVITFHLKVVEGGEGPLTAVGDLTVKGITREIAFPFTLVPPARDPTGLTTLALSATLTLDRLDFNIFPVDKKLPGGQDFIGRTVTIELNVLAVRAE